MNILSVTDIRAGYGAIGILHGISFEAPRSRVTALIGANGAGKTTLLRAIAGLLPLSSGSIVFEGKEIGRAPANRRVEAGIALVPEGRLVFPTMSVSENLRLGAIAPRARAGMRERLTAMYELFPRLQERASQPAGSLSGGEQQMLAMARGLMARPALLLLDEPTLGLAPVMARLVFRTLERLRDEGLAIVLAEQDVRGALHLADGVHVVENGRIALSGRSEDLLGDARVKSAYLGI
ncbi:MAG: ABC transporter ATP-binding protein [Betaproteobacteria bacterium RIFCSPLOWO2_02_FULL_64_12]|nr:MAG: ABC transporter ATP-binding protein [Betaproteobacteria bacterium RIFCSPLOWO2_02_FULL_64_12]